MVNKHGPFDNPQKLPPGDWRAIAEGLQCNARSTKVDKALERIGPYRLSTLVNSEVTDEGPDGQVERMMNREALGYTLAVESQGLLNLGWEMA